MYKPLDKSYYSEAEKILVAVDCIIFGFEADKLKLLLFKRKIEPLKGKWSLVGRFVQSSEDIRNAASNVLSDYAGLKNVFLQQLFTFGKVKRDPGARVISIVYYALIRISEYEKHLVEDYDSKWFDINELPELILDHDQMVRMARKELISKAQRFPIGAELLPPKFTLPKIFQLYQSLYDKKLDDRNFRKKLKALKIVKKMEEKDMSNSKKGAYYYVFDMKMYRKYLEEGYEFKL